MSGQNSTSTANEDVIYLDGVETSIDQIQPEVDRFPYCIVWTAIPLLTWLIPFIGHTGIAMSDGIIHDFAGPYYISVDRFAFGKPWKYVKLNRDVSKDKYDSAIKKADSKFCQLMHNLICNNCHSHVADALNNMAYQGKTDWTMVSVWFLLILSGRYVRQLLFKLHENEFIVCIFVCLFYAIFFWLNSLVE